MPDLPDLGDKLSSITDNSYFRKLLLLVPLIAAVFIVTDLILISLLAVASVFLPIFLNYAGIKMLGIELVTLTTILTALQLGPEAGAIAGFALMTAHMVAGQFSGAYILWVIPSYGVAGFVAGSVGLDITVIGVGTAVILNSVFTGLTYIISPKGLSHFIPHAVGNVVLNSAIFIYVAPQLLAMM